MKYDYDLKDELIKKTQESKNFAGYTKMAEFLRVYQILDDEKKKNLFIAGVVVLGVANFLSQYSIMLLKL